MSIALSMLLNYLIFENAFKLEVSWGLPHNCMLICVFCGSSQVLTRETVLPNYFLKARAYAMRKVKTWNESWKFLVLGRSGRRERMMSLVLGRRRRRRRVFPVVLDGEDRGRELMAKGRIPKREDSVEGEAAGDGVMENLEDSEVIEGVGVEAEVEDVVGVVVKENEVEDVVVERVVVDKKADVEVVEIVYVDNVELNMDQ